MTAIDGDECIGMTLKECRRFFLKSVDWFRGIGDFECATGEESAAERGFETGRV